MPSAPSFRPSVTEMVEEMRSSGLTYGAIADLAHVAPVTIWRISNNPRADVSYSTGLGVERAYAHVIGAGGKAIAK